jgi:hypothetical protein
MLFYLINAINNMLFTTLVAKKKGDLTQFVEQAIRARIVDLSAQEVMIDESHFCELCLTCIIVFSYKKT